MAPNSSESEDASNEEEENEEEVDEESEEGADSSSVNKNGKRGNVQESTQTAEELASFFMYVREKRAKVESMYQSFGHMCEALKAEFSDLSEEKKQKWFKKIQAENIDFSQEMVPYEKAGATSTRTKKDPNAPKRGKSAYFIYSIENRARIAKEHPQADFSKIAGITSLEFKELSEIEAKIYHDKSEEDKERYNREMIEYEAQKEQEAQKDQEAQEEYEV